MITQAIVSLMSHGITQFFFGALTFCILVVHFSNRRTLRDNSIIFLVASFLFSTFGVVVILGSPSHVPFWPMTLAVVITGVISFVLINEALLLGLASFLTKWRGEAWTKELDYLYLSLAAFGVVLSVNCLEIVPDKATGIDIYGPAVVAISLAIRFTKTRAEIGGWNKASTLSPTHSH